MNAFEEWWWSTGSAIKPKPGEDYEEHAKRVSRSLYEFMLKNNNDENVR